MGGHEAATPSVTGVALARAAGFFGCWLLLATLGTGADLIADLVAGLVAAAAATWISLQLLPPGPGRIHYGALGRLAWRFLWQSVVAGIDVARRAFAPRLSLQPGYLSHPARIPPGPGRAVFGALTSLVPGTLPVGAGPGDTLIYHCLDASQPAAQGLAVDEALLIQVLGGGDADD